MLLFVAVIQSDAAPFPAEGKQTQAYPQEPAPLLTARAGWNAGDVSPSSTATRNATLERLGPAGAAHDAKASLKRAAIPDFRAVAGILLVIMLLRRISTVPKESRRRRNISTPPDDQEYSRAA